MAASNSPNRETQPVYLSEASIAYYERMSLILSDPKVVESSSRESLVQNFRQQIYEDKLVNVSLNVKTSEVLENFVCDWCDSPDILILFRSINSDNLSLLAFHKSGSHVLETIIKRIFYFTYQEPSEDTAELVEHFAIEFVPLCIDICIDLAFDSYGSHILRTLVQTVCGVYLPGSSEKNATELLKKPEYQIFTPQDEFLHLPESILKKFTKSHRLLEAITDIFASNTIISLIEILSLFNLKLSKKLNKKLITSLTPHLHQIIDHERGSFVIQSLLSTAGENQYTQLLEGTIQGSIFKYSISKYANFVIQTLIANAHTEQHFIDILSELDSAETIGNILAFGCFGVVHQIVKTGLKFPAIQKQIKTILLQSFNCHNNKELLIPLLLLMMPSDNAVELNRLQNGNIVFQPQDSMHLHGSLIVQTLFSYEKTKLFAKSLLANSINGVFKIADDPNGSHVLDKFVASSKIKQKYKDKLFSMVESTFVQFACSKYGSRVLDSIWKEVDQAWRTKFINEIAKNEFDLKRDFYGKFILRNCKLELYKRKRSDWEKLVQWNVVKSQRNTGMKRRVEEPEFTPPTEMIGKEILLEKRPRRREHNPVPDNIDSLFDQLD